MAAPQEAIAIAVSAAHAADEKQAEQLVLLDVSELLVLVDLFLIATARTDRHLKAVAEEIERRLSEEHGLKPLRREGLPESGWYLLDFGDVVCHLFNPEQREFYALERLWGDVPQLDPLSGRRSTVGDALAR